MDTGHCRSARIISDYGIAADGNVVSVALSSARMPMEEIKTVYLDYQSRTSKCKTGATAAGAALEKTE